RLADLGLLAGDQREVVDGAVDQLGVAGGVADAHVHHDLHHAGDLHDVAVAEFLLQPVTNLVAVALLQPRERLLSVFYGGHVLDVLAVGLGDADLLAGLVVDAVTDAGRLAVGVDDHHVGDGDRRFLGDDAAGGRAALGA